jgi:hypothetical protein
MHACSGRGEEGGQRNRTELSGGDCREAGPSSQLDRQRGISSEIGSSDTGCSEQYREQISLCWIDDAVLSDWTKCNSNNGMHVLYNNQAQPRLNFIVNLTCFPIALHLVEPCGRSVGHCSGLT